MHIGRPVTPGPGIDSSFVLMARSHHEVVATLQRGLQRPGTVLALTGEAGLGKTVLLRHVLAGFAAGPVRIVGGANADLRGEWDALLAAGGPAARGVLVIEDAHAVPLAAMADFAAMLSRSDMAARPHVIFVAWPRFWPGLIDPALAGLREAIGVRAVVSPLSYPEAQKYVEHLFRLAGGSARAVLGADKLHALLLSAEGNPRRINGHLSRALQGSTGLQPSALELWRPPALGARRRILAAVAGVTITIAAALLAVAFTDTPLSFDYFGRLLPRSVPASLPSARELSDEPEPLMTTVPSLPPRAKVEIPPAPPVVSEPPAVAEPALAPPAPVAESPAAVEPAPPPPAEPRSPEGPSPRPNALPPSVVASLVRRGDSMMELKDVSAARRLYERAAMAGNARAALLLGGTFDPAHGATPETGANAGAAQAWYQLAVALGEAEAEVRLQALTGGRARE